MNKGRLIVIESGTDASGKETQTKKLTDRLKTEKFPIKKVEYPNYKSASSALVKMYLSGEFGDNPDDVNSYAASTFFAVDRYASYQKEWKYYYDRGNIILADRYTTSNMVHQAAKIEDLSERKKYLDWLWDLEFNKLALPIPDMVLFLDMPPQYSCKLLKNRDNKRKDIHESHQKYLEETYQNSLWIAKKYRWKIVKCVYRDTLKTIEEIHEELYHIVKLELMGRERLS